MKSLCFAVLAVCALAAVNAQNEDEALQIPIETNNQFPPDQLESEGLIEGSGAGGGIEEPKIDITSEVVPPPELENIVPEATENTETTTTADNASEIPCPKPCVCSIEGDTNNFAVDCSGYDLTEFPSPIDSRTTTLKLHNNKLTEIPKDISSLKNLKVLNAENNSIMDLALGSVSELPELTTLKLGNNRLIEYPKDLKNSLSLNKLEELDLGGNDIRTVMTSSTFSNFQSLRKIILPNASPELMGDLCGLLKDSLETVCSENCNKQIYECPDAPGNLDDGLMDAVIPGIISLSTALIENSDPAIDKEIKNEEPVTTEEPQAPVVTTTTTVSSDNIQAASDFSLRARVENEPQNISAMNAVVEAPRENDNEEVKVGAKTEDNKTGGVDKSVIGIIVAGMVVVVAGITIKKNWSSITKRFSSNPRPHERNGTVQSNGNGTAPEEVPLQSKSPV
ncbi:uncharacterized protein LOC121733450 [Aricia agestis]|uniref:uncharacterized protein LOC121733450 n=1 Tax=Aricia agestis TaxID=91739 RepID=UPI001C202161|nr:uncharacterized protein LOC121733450 [Aricia agestis]